MEGTGKSAIRHASISKDTLKLDWEIPVNKISPWSFIERANEIDFLKSGNYFVTFGAKPYAVVIDKKTQKKLWSILFSGYLTNDIKKTKLLEQAFFGDFIETLYPYYFTYKKEKGKVTKYVTTFPNGEEAITIVDNSNSDVLNLSSAESFYKYEILAPANHELIHGSSNVFLVSEVLRPN